VLDGATADNYKSVTDAPPPPPAAAPKPAEERDELKAEAEKLKDKEDVSLAGRRQDTDDARARAAVPQAKKSAGGPLRSSGPVQNQSNQINTQTYEMSVTRAVGGTDSYKNLDGGLRAIADNLGGTVVVVWKEKAYRIQ
jgi:hypothetical protein